jgi:hypothetical protein
MKRPSLPLGALAALLVASLVGNRASAKVPEPLGALVAEHCARCHDDNNALDLRALPAETDVRRWAQMLEMLESSKMPPPIRTGSFEKRFPLDPAVRGEMIDAVAALLGASADAPPSALHIKNAYWLDTVRELAAPILSPEKLKQVLNAKIVTFYPPMTPIYLVRLDTVSANVCSALAEAESSRSAAERTLMATLPTSMERLSTQRANRVVGALFTAVFGEQPTAADLTRGRELLTDLKRDTPSWAVAWTGLCASYLSGAKLQFILDTKLSR